MTLAAAMLRLMASPSTSAVWGTGKGRTGEPVDERMVRPPAKCAERAAHGFVGGAQDIEAIHLGRIHSRHGPGHAGVSGQLTENRRAACGRKFLGIVQVPVGEPFRQDDRRRHHRTGQRTAPGLVDPGDQLGSSGLPEPRFVFQMRPRRQRGKRGVGHEEGREGAAFTSPRARPWPACPCVRAGS